MNSKVNNIKELAGQLQLSPTAVLCMLHWKLEIYRIIETTRKKVIAAARKFNYYPNFIARGLKLEKTETIGLIIYDIAKLKGNR